MLQAGQSSVTLEGGNITFACPGKFSVKGNGHAFMGPGKGAAPLDRLPDSRVKLFDEQIRAMHSETGQPIAEMPYKIVTGDGEVFYGFTDHDGKTMRVGSAEPTAIKVYWGEKPPVEA